MWSLRGPRRGLQRPDQARRRVLLVGKGAPERGGIPSFLDTLLQSNLAETHELSFLNLAHGGTPQGGKLTVSNLMWMARDALAVRRAATAQDIVHIHSALSPTVTVLRAAIMAAAARTRGCAVVVHAHGGSVESWLSNRRRRYLMRVAMAPVRRVVVVWAAGEAALTGVLRAGRVRLIDNGVSLERHRVPHPAHDIPRVLFVGLLTARKGVLDLVRASQLLLERGVQHELWLLGGTPDEGPAAEHEVRAAVQGKARLLGTFAPQDMPAAYAEADVFCLPSWWEAMPLSVLEAMASALPVVATDVGDVSRLVEDGRTGFVVPAQSPEALASALDKVLSDPEAASQLGAAGRTRVERHFSSAATVREVARLYAELAPVPRSPVQR